MERSEAALSYAALGWHLVPLSPRGKKPWLPNWQNQASADEEQVAKWFTDRPNSNLGLQLGPRSGVIDIEGDEDGAEEDLLALFGGDVPVAPTYEADRGKHRLFKYRDDLPEKAVVKVGRVEIRIGGGAKGAQSVLPPSIHPSGKQYQWLVPPDDCDPPELPDAVVAAIWNLQGEKTLAESPSPGPKRSIEDWERIAKGVGEGERNESMAAWIGRDLWSRSDVQGADAVNAAWTSALAVNAANRPPLDEAELRRTFNSILAKERTRRMAVADKEGKTALCWDDWRLEIVLSEPRAYLLYSDLWEGHIRLTADDMLSARRICLAALEQKRVPLLPKKFGGEWEGLKGKPGLYQHVVDRHTTVEAPADEIRTAVLAQALLDFLDSAVAADSSEAPSRKGVAYRYADGSYAFQFGAFLETLKFSTDKFGRSEVSALLQRIGVGSTKKPDCKRLPGSDGTRAKTLWPENLAILNEIADMRGES